MARKLKENLPKPPADPREVEGFRKMMDRAQMTTREFCSRYRIQTKRKYLVNGKESTFIKYQERKAQADLRIEIERQWASGHGAKIVYDKDRQKGITTAIIALFWECFCRDTGGNAKILSRQREQTIENFRIAKSFETQTPDWVFSEILQGQIIASSRREIVLEKFDGSTSAFSVITASDKGLGRGGTVRWLLVDEYAYWDDKYKDVLGGMLDSWDDSPGCICIILSTGNGLDRFYREFERAMSGISGFVAMFSGWLEHPEKTAKFEDAKEKEKFAASLAKKAEYGIREEEDLLLTHKATLEQMLWRRQRIDSPNCGGDLGKFKRENPTTWRESFLTVENTIYPAEILDAHAPLGSQMDSDAKAGELFVEEVPVQGPVTVFTEKRHGAWTIYEPPQVGCVYAFGCDPAEGLEQHTDGGKDSDYSTIQVRMALSKRIVAIYESKTKPRELATEIIAVSTWYGRARGYVEANNHGHTVIDVMIEKEYGHLLLTRRRQIASSESGTQYTYAPGFLSKRDTKPRAVDRSSDWVRDLGLPKNGQRPQIPLRLIHQMQRYIRLNDSGKLGASMGHDDLVSADYLCHAALDVVEAETDKWTRVEPEFTPMERFVLRTTPVGPSGMEYDEDLGEGY